MSAIADENGKAPSKADAMAQANAECSGQCACTAEDDDAVSGDARCFHDGHFSTCRDRVLWAIDNRHRDKRRSMLSERRLIELVNRECSGQCIFPVCEDSECLTHGERSTCHNRFMALISHEQSDGYVFNTTEAAESVNNDCEGQCKCRTSHDARIARSTAKQPRKTPVSKKTGGGSSGKDEL